MGQYIRQTFTGFEALCVLAYYYTNIFFKRIASMNMAM